ncbi:MAG: hypothetical protein ACE14T_03180 [Syntrophales bacterium]
MLVIFSLFVPAIAGGQTGRLPVDDTEQVAVATAMSEISVRKSVQERIIEGTFNGIDSKGCAGVTVKILTDGWVAQIMNYRVCSGLIADGYRDSSDIDPAPVGIDDFTLHIAREAHKHGLARGLYEGFIIKAEPLRGHDGCDVEVRIFKGSSLQEKKIMNGCE